MADQPDDRLQGISGRPAMNVRTALVFNLLTPRLFPEENKSLTEKYDRTKMAAVNKIAAKVTAPTRSKRK